MERKLGQTNITATRSGVLTFVHTSLGAKVTEGETLARIADLSSFKILGTISDAYAAQLRVGMPVIVRINDKEVRGELLNIRPAISNNVISFDVSLSDKAANNLLRPRMKLEIFLVTDAHNNTVRVTNGPAFNGTASQTVFVLRPDGTAERRNVKTGLSSFDFIEITEGVQAGETIIISDMSAFRNAATVKVN